MKRVNKRLLLGIVAAVLLVIWFIAAVTQLHSGQVLQGAQQLEDAIRKAAVACYAAEGIYPPDLEYLKEHYGVRIQEDRYTVYYEIFADNLMPEITVLEKKV